VFGSLFVWMRATAFTPDGYVANALTVQGEGLLREKVTDYVRDDLLPQDRANALARRVVDPLPVDAQEKDLLAAGIAAAVRSQVGTAVNAFFDSGPGEQFASALSSRLSEEVVKLVQDQSGVFEFAGDTIVLNTEPIVTGARQQVEDALGDLARFLPPKQESYRQITLVQGDYVVTIQKAISLINLLSWLLPVLFLVLLAAGLLAARQRRPAAFRVMIAAIIGVAIAAITIRIARSVITGLVEQGPEQDVVDSILAAATTDLVDQTLVIVVIAAIVGFILWMFGPDAPARRTRGWFVDRWTDLLSGQPRPASRVTEFARRYRWQTEVAGLVAMIIALILVPSISVGTWILALLALAIWVLLIEMAACAGWLQAVARWIHGLRKPRSA
jgi:hypothetical protein